MSLNIDPDLSIRNQWARQHASKDIQKKWNRFVHHQPVDEQPGLDLIGDHHQLPPPPLRSPPKFQYPPKKRIVIKIGIVGAGAAGLFAAQVLDHLNFRLFLEALLNDGFKGVMPTMDDFKKDYIDPGCMPPTLYFKYEILESAAEERVGGRLFTYNFGDPKGPHDYYDVGAMRFPDNPVMTRTFDLFAMLGMKKTNLRDNPHAPLGSIIPYYMQNGDASRGDIEPWCYNDITHWGTYGTIEAQSDDGDPFKMSVNNIIPKDIMRHSPDEVMRAAIKPFRDALREDAREGSDGRSGWDLLMEWDKYSTREFLRTYRGPVQDPPPTIPPPPYNFETIQWLETFNGGTDWYDQAFSETVLESMDFEYDDNKDTDWFCILGGAQQLAKKMETKIVSKPKYNHRVTSIAATGKMQVKVSALTPGEKDPVTFEYNGLLNTTTLGCLRRMDLTDAGLPYPTAQAVRSLSYGPASKVAIKFSRAWWIHDLGNYSVRMGGIGHSDLNLRTCVYPSYNIYDPAGSSAVLLCSYTWQQDGQRIGAVTSSSPSVDHQQKLIDEAELKTMLIRELARMHRNDAIADDELFALIDGLYVDHHAFDWGSDPHTAGAFAFFRPQQFTHLWTNLIQPAGDVIIAGEAASPHHAWVVGALESVIHGLHAWMLENSYKVPELKLAAHILAKKEEGNPYVGFPPYMNKRISEWHATLGAIDRELHLKGAQQTPDAAALAEVFEKLGLGVTVQGDEAV
ncbi:amine oxidase [Podospora conica]|nr:amine oxidase [Schizothecium conicum]